MSEKKLTFAERVERMRAAAEDLRQIAEIVTAEAAAMVQAQTRFEGRKSQSGSISK